MLTSFMGCKSQLGITGKLCHIPRLERGFFCRHPHPYFGLVEILRSPLRYGAFPNVAPTAAPIVIKPLTHIIFQK